MNVHGVYTHALYVYTFNLYVDGHRRKMNWDFISIFLKSVGWVSRFNYLKYDILHKGIKISKKSNKFIYICEKVRQLLINK